MSEPKIRVLVVEASATEPQSVAALLGADLRIEIVGHVTDSERAMELLERRQVDVVTIDITLPHNGAFKLTQRIMQRNPAPVVLISPSWNPEDASLTIEAVEAGAVAVAKKPRTLPAASFKEDADKLVRLVKAMSEVKVVRRWSRSRLTKGGDGIESSSRTRSSSPEIKIVAIGTSTGGPLVLQTILRRIGANYPVPVLIVQHIAPEFVGGLADWLTESTNFPTHIGSYGLVPLPGHAYLAPDGFQMGINKDGKIILSTDKTANALCPSVSHLFSSVAESYGPRAIGVLLSGMGRDGADALWLMKQKGAMTVVQDRESSAVYGMPGEAISLNAATHVLSPEGIAGLLLQAVNQKNSEADVLELKRVGSGA